MRLYVHTGTCMYTCTYTCGYTRANRPMDTYIGADTERVYTYAQIPLFPFLSLLKQDGLFLLAFFFVMFPLLSVPSLFLLQPPHTLLVLLFEKLFLHVHSRHFFLHLQKSLLQIFCLREKKALASLRGHGERRNLLPQLLDRLLLPFDLLVPLLDHTLQVLPKRNKKKHKQRTGEGPEKQTANEYQLSDLPRDTERVRCTYRDSAWLSIICLALPTSLY